MSPSVFDPGLESITVAETELSDVDGEAGELLVRGYAIEDLAANADYEESLLLLLEGSLPTVATLEGFRSELAKRRGLDDRLAALLRAGAADGAEPMDAVRMGLAAATVGRDPEDRRAVATRLVAVLPTVVSTYWAARQGRDPVDPDPELGHAGNYLYTLTGDRPSAARRRAFETVLVTVLDHGLNPSTFTARTVVSTESDLVSAATAAAGALKGPRHGGNLQRVYGLLRDARAASDVDTLVRDRLAAEGELPGFGHRVYEVRDPRAAVLSATLERLPASDVERATIRALESAGTDALGDRHDGPAVPTVEFYAAAVLSAVGVPPALFTATFAVSRVGGWMAHCLEQLDNNRLVRPVGRYVGATGRSWTPRPERGADGDRSSVEPVAETLGTLAEPARLEILVALSSAAEPLSYSTLRERTSIDDKGRFNYHLRKLRGPFVADREEGYALAPAGRRFVETVVDGELFET